MCKSIHTCIHTYVYLFHTHARARTHFPIEPHLNHAPTHHGFTLKSRQETDCTGLLSPPGFMRNWGTGPAEQQACCQACANSTECAFAVLATDQVFHYGHIDFSISVQSDCLWFLFLVMLFL